MPIVTQYTVFGVGRSSTFLYPYCRVRALNMKSGLTLDFYSDIVEQSWDSESLISSHFGETFVGHWHAPALDMSSTAALPLLLPTPTTKTTSYPEWKPQRYLQPPQPPIVDDQRIHDLELAVQRQLLDGKALKKTRPRRTVDYAGGLGRWALVRCHEPTPSLELTLFSRTVSQATTQPALRAIYPAKSPLHNRRAYCQHTTV
jgi:hypothetical protein